MSPVVSASSPSFPLSSGAPPSPAPPTASPNLPLIYTPKNPIPTGGQACSLVTEDGIALRVARWPHPEPHGTVLIFPGRTEYIEMYFATVAFLRSLGWACAVVDWRGAGLSERPLSDPRKCHVENFRQYQLDAEALIGSGATAALPKPWILLAHSMGGAIGLRFMINNPDVFHGAVFSAPMFGLQLGKQGNRIAAILAHVAAGLGFAERYAFGCNPQSAAERGFANNPLTSSRDQFERLRAVEQTAPQLALGGITWGWLRAAFQEMNELQALDCPFLPKLVLVGDQDRVVDIDRIRRFVLGSPNTRYQIIPQGLHCPLQESEEPLANVRLGIAKFLQTRCLANAEHIDVNPQHLT